MEVKKTLLKVIKTLLIVVVSVVLLLVGLIACAIHFGIWFSRPLDTSLDRTYTYSNCLWTTESEEYAFVADSNAYCYGQEKGSDEILRFMIGGYSAENSGHVFRIYSTGENQLENAFKASNKKRKLESLELPDVGYAMPVGQYDEVIEVVMEDGEVLRFEKQELSQEYSFEDASIWPEEMQEWLEQKAD